MAWSYRTRRTFTRTAKRSFRRRSVARPRYQRRYGRRRVSRKTTSSPVTLTLDASWSLFNPASPDGNTPRTWNPFVFSPVNVPGFMDYRTTYSHFRVLKAKLYISRAINSDPGTTYNYLVVGSRPFAASEVVASTTGSPFAFVPAQTEAALRQTKWQKVRYPGTTKNVVTAGFYPYAIVQTYGPISAGSTGNLWQRIWEGKRWMPFAWARPQVGVTPARGMAFYGPYMVVDSSTGEIPDPSLGQDTNEVQCTLKITVQFKGQR